METSHAHRSRGDERNETGLESRGVHSPESAYFAREHLVYSPRTSIASFTMARQTKIPPVFSICLVIARHTDAQILVSKLDLVSPPVGLAQEFPHSLYVDVLEMLIDSTLDKRPTEKELLDTTNSKLASLAASPHCTANKHSISYLNLYESPNWGLCMYVLPPSTIRWLEIPFHA